MLHHRKFYVPLYWNLPLLELSYMKKKTVACTTVALI